MTAAATPPGVSILPQVQQFLEHSGRPHQLFIDGQWVDALAGETFETIDPATGQALTTVAYGRAADVDRAVAAARRAFEGEWKLWTPAQRQRLLYRASEAIAERAQQFAQLEALDNGKSVTVAQAVDVTATAEIFWYYAGWATKIDRRRHHHSVGFVRAGRQVPILHPA
jgi:acyl-CoA reductase-like NAD-dependent aldehyde dehydrogenase